MELHFASLDYKSVLSVMSTYNVITLLAELAKKRCSRNVSKVLIRRTNQNDQNS
jgi:hypothetical protein